MTATTVTVYTRPSCVQCTATKRRLDAKGIAYAKVDMTINAAAPDYVTDNLGYSAAPVVVIDDRHHW